MKTHTVVALLLLAGCDSSSVIHFEEQPQGANVAEGEHQPGGRAATTIIPLCIPGSPGNFDLALVHRSDASARIAAGAQIPGIGALDASCRPAEQRPSCPCFSARELVQSVGGAEPTPYLYFDTFNWWGHDARRTELRSTVTVNGVLAEQVAAVYISPHTPQSHALMCHYAGVRLSPSNSVRYEYRSNAPTVQEAEACRRVIDVVAGDLECQGLGCGRPYTPEQLDPSNLIYQHTGAQPPLHHALRQTIDDAAIDLRPSRQEAWLRD